jgi:hypothetical protein
VSKRWLLFSCSGAVVSYGHGLFSTSDGTAMRLLLARDGIRLGLDGVSSFLCNQV